MSVLTPRALAVLRQLAAAEPGEDDADLLAEGWIVYLGTDRIHRSTMNRLLSCGAISKSYDDGPYWTINDTGRAIARRPDLADEVFATYLAGRGAFSIVNDQIVRLDR